MKPVCGVLLTVFCWFWWKKNSPDLYSFRNLQWTVALPKGTIDISASFPSARVVWESDFYLKIGQVIVTFFFNVGLGETLMSLDQKSLVE